MRKWLAEYTIKISTSVLPQTNNIGKICELLEKGVYTIDMFSKRNVSLEKEIRKLQSSEKDLIERKSSQKQYELEKAEIIPTTQYILDSYDKLSLVCMFILNCQCPYERNDLSTYTPFCDIIMLVL